jgi:hypothetical protein
MTVSQMSLLRRIEFSVASLPDSLRSPGFDADVETLSRLDFLVVVGSELRITAAGLDCLRRGDAAQVDSQRGELHVLHGRDQSLTVEYRMRGERP